MIAVEGLAVRTTRRGKAGGFALSGISFEVAAGEYGVLMGRTGAGKTTILETLCGLRRPTAGRIIFAGRDVTDLKPADRGIGYVPQDRALFISMSVYDHLAFALIVRKWPGKAIAERVAELAEWLSIGHLLGRKPQGLSGGEAQRVALGRALAARPAILLLDEPLSALDEETRQEMCELLRSVQRRSATTTLHITHSQQEATRLADRLLLLTAAGVKISPIPMQEPVR
jgi:molybdate/tungstate transport system ATP-binding protein